MTEAFIVSPEDGSVYTLTRRTVFWSASPADYELIQHAIYADGTFKLTDEDACAVDFARGVEDADRPRLEAIAEMLVGMSDGENNLESVEGYRLTD